MVGRPKAFDPGTSLARAMEVFWRKGYEATSVQDLLEAMEINRGSMYDTFGCKQELFVKAIRHYAGEVDAKVQAILDQPGPPLEGLREMFRMMESVLFDSGDQCPGCLMTTAAVEMVHRDASIAAEITSLFAHRQAALERQLERAGDAVRSDIPIPSLAAYLVAVSHGSVVSAKAGASRESIRAVHDLALNTLTGAGLGR